MTTICVARKGGRAAIACDTCTNWGDTLDTAKYVVNHTKIFAAGDAYVAMTGPTSVKAAIAMYFDEGRLAEFRDVRTVYKTWLALHSYLKDECYLEFQTEEDDAFESSAFSALIASPAGIFGVSKCRAVQEFTRFYALGRGSEHASGAMFAVYDNPAISVEEVVLIGITAAAEFQESTRLPAIVRVVDLA